MTTPGAIILRRGVGVLLMSLRSTAKHDILKLVRSVPKQT